MDDVPWKPSRPEDVCSLCEKEVTPRTAALVLFGDGVKEIVCFQCIELIEREGRQYPHDY